MKIIVTIYDRQITTINNVDNEPEFKSFGETHFIIGNEFNIRSKIENEVNNIEVLDEYLNINGFGEADILETIETTTENIKTIE